MLNIPESECPDVRSRIPRQKWQNSAPVWKKLMKDVDIQEPTSFLDHIHLGCTQRECKPNEKIIEQYNKMFESRISAGATVKFPRWDKPRAKTSAWSYDIEGHARKCVERCCELANIRERAEVGEHVKKRNVVKVTVGAHCGLDVNSCEA